MTTIYLYLAGTAVAVIALFVMMVRGTRAEMAILDTPVATMAKAA